MKTASQLQQDVLDELRWEPAVDAARIGVEVADGIVTLAGHAAWSAPGVSNVREHIAVIA